MFVSHRPWSWAWLLLQNLSINLILPPSLMLLYDLIRLDFLHTFDLLAYLAVAFWVLIEMVRALGCKSFEVRCDLLTGCRGCIPGSFLYFLFDLPVLRV